MAINTNFYGWVLPIFYVKELSLSNALDFSTFWGACQVLLCISRD